MSEERIVPTAAEFASAASRATYICTNILQALLIACVVLWVLDVPRQVFNLSFYTEQLLTVCLGFTLALAYIAEGPRKPSAIDPAGVIAIIALLAYIAYSFPNPAAIPLPLWAGLLMAVVWTLLASRVRFARWFDWVSAAVSLILCGYIAVRYEALTYDFALLPIEGIVSSAILIFLVLEASRRISGFGFVGVILAMAVYIYVSPFFPGDFQTRWVSPERAVSILPSTWIETDGRSSSGCLFNMKPPRAKSANL